MPRTPTPVGRAARGIDREAARKHKRRNMPKPFVFPCCLSIDVPDARRPAPTGGGMGASLCASARLSVLCVKRLSELRPLSVQSATQVDHLISIGLLTRDKTGCGPKPGCRPGMIASRTRQRAHPDAGHLYRSRPFRGSSYATRCMQPQDSLERTILYACRRHDGRAGWRRCRDRAGSFSKVARWQRYVSDCPRPAKLRPCRRAPCGASGCAARE